METGLTSAQETLQSRPTVEPYEATLERVASLPHVLDISATSDQLGDDPLHVDIVGTKISNGYDWVRWYSDPQNHGYEKITATSELGLQTIAQQAAREFRSLDEPIAKSVRWWGVDGHHDMREDVQENVIEVFRISNGDASIDILNLSDEPLSEDEYSKLEDTLRRVDAYTGGRIFGEMKGIAFRKSDRFGEGMAGEYAVAHRFASINIDDIRAKHDEPQARYAQYFPGTNLSRFQITLAHELGHGVDVRGFMMQDPNQSHFNGKLGWENVDAPYDDNKPQECPADLQPITDYAGNSPSEDFAETFAIIVMGGDRSQFPERAKVMDDYIRSHQSESRVGPGKITGEQLDTLTPLIPTACVFSAHENKV